MIKNLQRAIIAISERSQIIEQAKLMRRFVALGWGLVKNPSQFKEKLEGLADVADRHEAEVSTWVSPEVMRIEGGAFDACDLRHWLALADVAGVPAVPVREILRLSEDEMSLASGKVTIPQNAVTKKIQSKLRTLAEEANGGPIAEPDADPEDALDIEVIQEKMASAMDEVPEGWMVRSARCGGSNLKALAGFGAVEPVVPEVKFGPNLEVGPGWIRRGNRRSVHVSDNRTVESYAQGPGGDCVFLARPWVEANRYAVGYDPHRHGTQFAGKGTWPAEWRAFVEAGVVVGVASYYGWCGSVTAENARIALEVRDLAQRIVDAALALKAYPRFADIELLRSSGHPDLENEPKIREAMQTFGRETVSCTLDFIEARGIGIMLLEGGPPNSPFGGGHPCAFAGRGGRPTRGNKTITEGVAFRLMPHVTLGDYATWEDGDATDCILDWDAVETLAKAA